MNVEPGSLQKNTLIFTRENIFSIPYIWTMVIVRMYNRVCFDVLAFHGQGRSIAQVTCSAPDSRIVPHSARPSTFHQKRRR